MKRVLPILLVLAVAAAPATAQDNLTTILYNVSQPTGQLENWISNTSYRGATLEFMKYPTRDAHYTTGVSLGWQVFDQESNGTTQIENGAVTGSQRRYSNVFPLMLMGNYYIGNERGTRVLMGFGFGAFYSIQRFELGVRAIEETNWHFGIAPQLGLQLPVGLEVEFVLTGRYNVAFSAGKGVDGDTVDLGYATVSAGLAYLSW